MSMIDGALMGCVALLALAVAGTLRELAFLQLELQRMQREAGRRAVSAGDPLPRYAADAIGGRLLTGAGAAHYLVFLESGCSSCLDYARRLGDLLVATPTTARDVTAVVAGSGADRIEEMLRSAGVVSIPDRQRRIADEMGITGTPATIAVDVATGAVAEIWVGEEAEMLFLATGHSEI